MGRVFEVAETMSVLPESERRAQIISAISGRCNMMKSCAEHTGYLLRDWITQEAIPSARPSEPDTVRSEKIVMMRQEFTDSISYLEEYKKVSGLGSKDPHVPLITRAETFFKESGKTALGIMEYCRTLEEKLREEFKAKTFYSGHRASEECADYAALVIFILEKQLGILNNFQGINPGGPQGEEPTFVSLQLSGPGTVWSGPKGSLQARRDFIDKLLGDESKSGKFKEAVWGIKRGADEVGNAFGQLVNVIHEAAVKVEADAQRAANKPKPGLWYKGQEGRLEDGEHATTFNKAGSREVFEALLVRREISREDMLALMGRSDAAKRKLTEAVGYLNRTFKKKGLVLKVEKNTDGIYKLNPRVALDPE